MAVTAREVIMVFRGQNYLSSAIRRVGRDVGMLGRTQQLQAQRAQLQIVRQRLETSRSIAQNELASIQSGTRHLALQKAKNRISDAEYRTNARLQQIYNQQNDNLQRRLNLQNRAEKLTKSQGGLALEQIAASKTVPPNVARSARQIQLAQATNLSQLEELEKARIRQIALIEAQSLDSQQLAAKIAEEAQRTAVLTQQINNTSRALELNTAKQNENAAAW